jgi:hypothetical protein
MDFSNIYKRIAYILLLLIIKICKCNNNNEIYRIPIGLYNWNEEKKNKFPSKFIL